MFFFVAGRKNCAHFGGIIANVLFYAASCCSDTQFRTCRSNEELLSCMGKYSGKWAGENVINVSLSKAVD